MKVNQIFTIVNNATQQVLGESAVLEQDLTNVVDIGEEVFNANQVENFTKALIDQIGRIVFVDRVYAGTAPSVLMDDWEYASVIEKVDCDIPDAEANNSWSLQDGTEYKQDTFKQPKVHAKFFNGKVTFEVPLSIAEMQVKSAFSGPTQLNGFLSMLYNSVEKSMTIKLDSLIMSTISNMMAETLYDEYQGTGYETKSTVKAVNLLKLYNTEKGTNLTDEKAVKDPDFIRYASYMISLYGDRMKRISTLFNVGGRERFTPTEKMHVIMLSDFYKAAEVYLQSDVWHNELTKLPDAETVPYWQGSGNDYSFTSVSKINVKHGEHTVELSGILGVIFDHDALGVTQMNKRVTSHYNAKAEFVNSWYKVDAHYFNDMNENCVVFFVA